ncbi:hypothetical protein SNOG_15177 [Parastagonospora nodorum SN15]|uniref:Uncharacterized protein n=1 Tax=Phaeosphaeria nodorum (strain SN15 / ATCC MYA-4574 / FGSC 10173) TaxID=321614 RepID=Q0TZ53_PHANO|nr:hypothetical protein SNOG_15177 [Parastagonospora nodorum SN15]EAT77402.1 hypothetical protein SNOG_15177 [Parastagonospora nodorum SN15]
MYLCLQNTVFLPSFLSSSPRHYPSNASSRTIKRVIPSSHVLPSHHPLSRHTSHRRSFPFTTPTPPLHQSLSTQTKTTPAAPANTPTNPIFSIPPAAAAAVLLVAPAPVAVELVLPLAALSVKTNVEFLLTPV